MRYPINYKLELVKIESLEIDERYQRDVQSNSRYIGENFDPLAAGAIIVAVRKGGRMFIADGLQRYTGAKAAGYTEIPALTFKSFGIEQEAKLFAMLNGKHRVKVTASQNFKARLEAKEEDATTINKVVSNAGFQLLLGNAGIPRWPIVQSIPFVETVYEDDGPEVLKTILMLVRELWKPNADALRESFLKGFWTFYVSANEHENFNIKRMKEKFIKIEPIKVIRDAARKMIEKSFSGFARHKFIQLELLEIYNKRTPKENKFEL